MRCVNLTGRREPDANKEQSAAACASGAADHGFLDWLFHRRQSIPYEVAAQTEHAVKQTDELPAQEESDKPDAAAENESEAEEAAQPEITYPLDLNRATLEELMTLPRIGEKLAQRILDYRAQYGRFSAPEQLMDVEGIGEGTFEGLRELVTVEDSK